MLEVLDKVWKRFAPSKAVPSLDSFSWIKYSLDRTCLAEGSFQILSLLCEFCAGTPLNPPFNSSVFAALPPRSGMLLSASWVFYVVMQQDTSLLFL